MENKAAYLTEAKANPLKVDSAPVGKPGPGQLLIKNKAIAINPVDWKIQDHGIFVQNYPWIGGEDIAGEVVEVGPDVSNFKTGDRVIAHCVGLVTQQGEMGAFQLYTVAFANVAAKIPDSVKWEEAAVLPLAVSTASAGLFMKEMLGLNYPSADAKPTGKSLLVYGASSSVGAVAVQLAVASGYKVITTCSPQHHEMAKSLGATEVFDYKDGDVVDKLVSALKSAGDFVGVYDAVALPPTLKICAEVTKKLGGGFMATTLEPSKDLPEGVKASWCFAPAIQNKEPAVAEAVWGKYIPQALANGSFKCKPDAEVVGSGLESIQTAFNKHKEGVSGKKIVVTL